MYPFLMNLYVHFREFTYTVSGISREWAISYGCSGFIPPFFSFFLKNHFIILNRHWRTPVYIDYSALHPDVLTTMYEVKHT